jgi:hypothetical protein
VLIFDVDVLDCCRRRLSISFLLLFLGDGGDQGAVWHVDGQLLGSQMLMLVRSTHTYIDITHPSAAAAAAAAVAAAAVFR